MRLPDRGFQSRAPAHLEPLREIPVKLSVRVTSEHSWDDIYESQPTAKQPGELLIIRHRGNQPNEYLYTRINSKDQAPRPGPLDRKEVFQPFAGSDFFIGDLGLEFFHWPTQRLIKKEMRKGRSCRVIESINPTRDGAYSRVLSWLDFETDNIIMAEGYDRAGRVLKEFSIRKVSRSEGRAQLKEMEIRNDQSDSRTRLEFNLEVEEK